MIRRVTASKGGPGARALAAVVLALCVPAIAASQARSRMEGKTAPGPRPPVGTGTGTMVSLLCDPYVTNADGSRVYRVRNTTDWPIGAGASIFAESTTESPDAHRASKKLTERLAPGSLELLNARGAPGSGSCRAWFIAEKPDLRFFLPGQYTVFPSGQMCPPMRARFAFCNDSTWQPAAPSGLHVEMWRACPWLNDGAWTQCTWGNYDIPALPAGACCFHDSPSNPDVCSQIPLHGYVTWDLWGEEYEPCFWRVKIVLDSHQGVRERDESNNVLEQEQSHPCI